MKPREFDPNHKCMEKYKVGSLLNIPFGVSQKKEVFAEVITQIQKKSLEEIGDPLQEQMSTVHNKRESRKP